MTLLFFVQTQYVHALKFLFIQNNEGLGKTELSTDFRNFTKEGGSPNSSQSSYFGSTISSKETKMNRAASYHLIFANTYGLGYTEIPMEHTFTLANGNSYVRDLRVNEIDLSLVIRSRGEMAEWSKAVD